MPNPLPFDATLTEWTRATLAERRATALAYAIVLSQKSESVAKEFDDPGQAQLYGNALALQVELELAVMGSKWHESDLLRDVFVQIVGRHNAPEPPSKPTDNWDDIPDPLTIRDWLPAPERLKYLSALAWTGILQLSGVPVGPNLQSFAKNFVVLIDEEIRVTVQQRGATTSVIDIVSDMLRRAGNTIQTASEQDLIERDKARPQTTNRRGCLGWFAGAILFGAILRAPRMLNTWCRQQEAQDFAVKGPIDTILFRLCSQYQPEKASEQSPNSEPSYREQQRIEREILREQRRQQQGDEERGP